MEKKNNIVVMAFDATREIKENELQLAIENVILRGGILGKGDLLVVLGVLHSLQHPSKYIYRFIGIGFNNLNNLFSISYRIFMFAHIDVVAYIIIRIIWWLCSGLPSKTIHRLRVWDKWSRIRSRSQKETPYVR